MTCTPDWHVYEGAPKPGNTCRCGEQTFTSWADAVGPSDV